MHHKTGTFPVESALYEKWTIEFDGFHNILKDELNRQLDVVGKLDTKSSTIVALDAGIIVYISSLNSAGISKWLAIASIILIIFGLCVSLAVIVSRHLHLYLSSSFWLTVKKEKFGDARLFLTNEFSTTVNTDRFDYSHLLLEQLTDHNLHNRSIIKRKGSLANTALILSIMGFILLGLAQIIKFLMP